MRHLMALIVAMVLAGAGTFSALAQTDADCTAGVQEVRQFLSENATMSEEKSQQARSILAQAQEAGARGEYSRCLELVDLAKSYVGMPWRS